jgi:hypothetical protein
MCGTKNSHTSFLKMQALIPGTYELVLSCGRRNCTDVTKSKILKQGDFHGSLGWIQSIKGL